MMITIKQAGKHEMRRIDEEDSENWREKSMGGGGGGTVHYWDTISMEKME